MKRKINLLLIGILGILLTSCTLVDSGEVGIKFKKFSVTSQGTIDAIPVSGVVGYNIFTESVYTYPVTVQRVNYAPFVVTTKDAAEFYMDPVIAYQLDRDKAAYVFGKYRKPLAEIEKGYMFTCVQSAYRSIANGYTSDELMGSRVEYERRVKQRLDTTLLAEGFILSEFTSQLKAPEGLQATIDAKNKAIQEALKAENEVKKAEANAKIAIAKAEGEAKAMKIKADAEAYYNRTISASLSPMIVQEDFLEKWDGKMPQYYMPGGNGGGVMKILP